VYSVDVYLTNKLYVLFLQVNGNFASTCNDDLEIDNVTISCALPSCDINSPDKVSAKNASLVPFTT